MGKIVWIWGLCCSVIVWGETLENSCLSCHKTQQIPNTMVYKRYLIKYSISSEIEEAMLAYMLNPQKETSIMPPQFFLKFPMKEKRVIDEQSLRKNIKQFIKKFDIKQNLVLEGSSH